jgi:hypothetical protein
VSVWAGLNWVSMEKMATSCGNVEIISGSIPDAGFSNVISWHKTEFPDFRWDKNLYPMLLKFLNFPRLISERERLLLVSSVSQQINNFLHFFVTLGFHYVLYPTASLESTMVRSHLSIWQPIEPAMSCSMLQPNKY